MGPGVVLLEDSYPMVVTERIQRSDQEPHLCSSLPSLFRLQNVIKSMHQRCFHYIALLHKDDTHAIDSD